MDGGGWSGEEGETVRGVGGWPTIAFLNEGRGGEQGVRWMV